MIYYLRDKKGFLLLLELIFTLAIICFLVYMTLNIYFKRPSLNNKEVNKALSEQGIDTSNYQEIKDTIIKKMDDINKQRLKEMEDLQRQLAQ